MAAIYHLPCPVCGGKCWDNKAPGGKYPWTPNKPIAKCQDKNCSGAFWEPKGGSAPATQTQAAPQPKAVFTPAKAQVPVDKDVERYYEILSSVLLHHAGFIKDAPLAGEQAVEIASTATFSDLRTIATTIQIARNDRG